MHLIEERNTPPRDMPPHGSQPGPGGPRQRFDGPPRPGGPGPRGPESFVRLEGQPQRFDGPHPRFDGPPQPGPPQQPPQRFDGPMDPRMQRPQFEQYSTRPQGPPQDWYNEHPRFDGPPRGQGPQFEQYSTRPRGPPQDWQRPPMDQGARAPEWVGGPGGPFQPRGAPGQFGQPQFPAPGFGEFDIHVHVFLCVIES